MRPPIPSAKDSDSPRAPAVPPPEMRALALSGLLRVQRRWSLTAKAAANTGQGHDGASREGRPRLPPHLEDSEWGRLAIGLATDVLCSLGVARGCDVVQLGPDTVTVHVPTTQAPPAPFTPGRSPGTWLLSRDTGALAALPVSPAITVATRSAALVTVGLANGRRTLVDLVAVGSTLLSGPQAQLGVKLAEIAVELGTRRWSDLEWLLLVGFDMPMPQLDGVRHVPDLAAALAELDRLTTGDGRGPGSACVIVPPWVGTSELPALIARADQSEPFGVLHCFARHKAGCVWELAHGPRGVPRLSFAGGRTVRGPVASEPRRRTPARAGAPRGAVVRSPVEVAVLGDVQVSGTEESFRHRRRLTELVAYLAMHPEGTSSEAFATALWPERRVPVQTLANRLSEARRALGLASDGRPRLRKVARRHLIAECVTDWDRFRVLGASGGDLESWRSALALVRGRPFGGLDRGEWAQLEGFSAAMEAATVDLACRVGEHALAANDAGLAHWAALQGLLASPWDERLYRLLMRAADGLGNRGGVDAALRGLAVALEIDGDPLLAVHPETSALYRQLTARARA